ncbi:biotin--[acetyl-CoA-carboxylase] ligase [Chitinibacter tainanensis]|uniref:biotin--[acetyl-CoA-carboxylase] ligase n=1 Tax=Chitinibacter tainanensis TaxID=230667 RepID=UPI00235317FE|nr:biotin--[acetyl-CoA-carboxylase] ligase [Chitinibacter tainanensis]
MTDPIRLLRELDALHFTSGTAIAERLGISRASVSTALAQAEDYGIALTRRTGAGYQLATPIEWLDLHTLNGYLPADTELSITLADTLDSTNRQLLKNPQHGHVLACEWQTGGRGRLGRRWLGALGGSLMFSMAWQFAGGPAQLAGLSLAVGAMVAETLAAAGVRDIGLKWPNDLLLPATTGSAKVGGILIEMQGDALGPAQVVIGIGLNLQFPAHWQAELGQSAASLQAAGLALGRNALLAALLSRLECGLRDFAHSGFAPLLPVWESYSAWQGEQVQVLAPTGATQSGVLLGLAADGSLRLGTAAGEQLIHTGDVSLRRANSEASHG